MAIFQWVAPEAIQTYFSTGLNSLANGSFSGDGAAIDNETGLYQYISLELALASLSPTAGSFVDVWLIGSLDGTNYATTGKSLHTAHLLTTFGLDTTAATAQTILQRNLALPPLKFKMNLRNAAGVALNASGNTLKYRRHNEQSA